MEKKSILKLTELPERAEKLSPETLQQIFGGAGGHCAPCNCQFDCSGELYCRDLHINGSYYASYCVSWGEYASNECL